MSISLTEDVRTVTDLRDEPLEILKQIHRTGRPIVVTSKGKPDIVMLDAATYERRLKSANLASLLLQAEADIRAGRVRPAAEFFPELIGAKKVSR